MRDEISELYTLYLQEKDIFKKAQLLTTLTKDKGIRIVEVAKELKMKPSYVSHILRLNKLPALVIDGYYSNSITPTHLYILARLHNHQQMIAAYEHVLSNNLSALDTELLVRTVLYGVKNVGEYLNVDEIRAFTVLMKKLGINAKIIQSRIRSKCVLEMKGDLQITSAKLREIMKLLEKTAIEEPRADFL